MKGQIALVNSIIHLTVADQYMSSFVNDNPHTRGATIMRVYCDKIRWIQKDLITNPRLPEEVRQGIKNEVTGDVLVIPALAEKMALLSDENRQAVEVLIDGLLSGEKIIVEKINQD